jgi:hypothetical protein
VRWIGRPPVFAYGDAVAPSFDLLLVLVVVLYAKALRVSEAEEEFLLPFVLSDVVDNGSDSDVALLSAHAAVGLKG